ncbi:MAG: Holliday junction branch migration protein RuvA [Anaerolineae bacterium]|nr:Holliday junction branch migration protein RuvA [Anaerolineae bacterium]
MIDILDGQVATIGDGHVVIMIGGIGLRVHVPTTLFDVIDGPGQHITLYTHLVVRDDALTLYGFPDQEERALFDLLVSISGVGPRIALAVLSTLTVEHIRNAVGRDDPAILTRVPGIGKKLAQKLVFELKDKIAVDAITGIAALSDLDTDVIAVMTTLGYSIVEAQAALQSIPRDAPDDVEERVRLALQHFG